MTQHDYYYGDARDKYYEFAWYARYLTSPLFGIGQLVGLFSAPANRVRRHIVRSKKEFFKTHADAGRRHWIAGHAILFTTAYTIVSLAYLALKGKMLLAPLMVFLAVPPMLSFAVTVGLAALTAAWMGYSLLNLKQAFTALRAGWKQGLNGRSPEPPLKASQQIAQPAPAQ